MKIGTFTKTDDGTFTGRIATLNLTADLIFQPAGDKTNDKAPDFRVVSANTNAECGAGWHEMSRNNKPYISVKIDDPSFAYPIWAALTRDDSGELSLYWDRPKAKRNDPSDTADQGETL
ncbi:MAG: DUF736 domain-containing protein [Novosphingobium sp.]|nr:DUF736 domain-containing protein [Novosphingobium sp.]